MTEEALKHPFLKPYNSNNLNGPIAKIDLSEVFDDKELALEQIIRKNSCKFLQFLEGGDIYGLISENFFAKTAYIGVKSCEKSIARIPEA